jgi:cation diffusion facilitator family transporter
MVGTHNYTLVKRILLVILVLNWAVASAKTGYGFMTGALSMMADGFHSFMDGASNVIGLLTIKIAAKPPDASHPYGHRKFEAFATLCIAGMLGLTAYEIAIAAAQRIGTATLPTVTTLSFLIMIGTLMVNVWVTRYELRRGRELQSPILTADAMHTRSDIFATVAVLASLAAARAGFALLDIIVALLIVGLIAWSALEIIRNSIITLTDASRVDPAVIEQVACSVPGVLACHQVRSRGFEDAITIDCHIWVKATLSTQESHRITHDVMQRVKTDVPGVVEVVIHTEPAPVGSGQAEGIDH